MKKDSHRAPWECVFPKENKSECKPGKRPKSDQEYFEILCLCVLQTGLGWGQLRKNWQKLKKSFYGFNINKLARAKVSDLIKMPNTIKNRGKIKAIVRNAKEFEGIKKEYGSFWNFLKTLKELKDREVLKILTKRFKYIGDYNANYYLHSAGYWK